MTDTPEPYMEWALEEAEVSSEFVALLTGEPCKHGCHDLKPDEADCNWWEVTVDEGRANVQCATCGCTYDPLTWDGAELLYTDVALPVRVVFEHCSSEWHGENRCDHGWTIGVSPRKRS